MNVPTWVWLVTVGTTTAVLLFDVFVIGRRPHVPSNRETGTALAVYVGMALLFGLGVWRFGGLEYAGEYYAGWLTEYSLSIDNLFVFLLLMGRFGVPEWLQQSALMVGIGIALVLRGIFIAVGAAVINQFAWVFYLFGAFLIYTAVTLVTGHEEDDDSGHADQTGQTGQTGHTEDGDGDRENRLLRFVQRRFPATQSWEGGRRLFVMENGRRLITPMFVVILALGTTDLLFALDSIPAIYGLTSEPFLVLTANIFALMGLRQLYFLIGGLLKRLVYLSLGLSVLLGFIGVKLILHAMHENTLPFLNGGDHIAWAPDIPIWLSLVAIVGILSVTTAASLLTTRRGQRAERPA